MKTTVKTTTLLIVDDLSENLIVARNAFNNSGYNITTALSGQEAMVILETIPVDLVLLDVMMPQMDGYEVCEKIKANSKLKDIPIIFLTARNDKDSIVTGFLKGGVDYITKPFNKEELICRVNTHLELKQARKQIVQQAEELRKSNKLILNTLYQFGHLYDSINKESEKLKINPNKLNVRNLNK